ncbi:MAG TPA: phosphatidate cytidylyltransferase [Kofleriaceae bacterium]|nr:phosphatidate cytidylyltransferase [Kofleriaceae bacterium]
MQPELRPPEVRRSRRGRELGARFATAVLLLPPLALAVWYGAPVWPLLLAAAGVVATKEYYQIVFTRLPAEAWPGIAAAFLLPLLPYAAADHAAGAAFWILTCAAVAAWLVRLWRGSPAGATATVGHVLAGLLFSGPGLFALASIRSGADGREWTLALLLVTWANDGCAYGVGRALGRHRLAPVVSPGKTWEGFAGGALGSLAATLAVWAWLLPSASPLDLSVLAIGTALVGPLGDLAKSMVKRAHGVKDSGRLLPGHGGLLDRIDALLWNGLVIAALRAGAP